jgi:hypothetical protein
MPGRRNRNQAETDVRFGRLEIQRDQVIEFSEKPEIGEG